MIDETKLQVIENARRYFIKMDDTISQLLLQFNAFGTSEQAYLLIGNMSEFKQNLKRMSNLLNRIQNDLATAGVCIIEPIDEKYDTR